MGSETYCECSRRGVLQILDAGSLLFVLVLQGSVLNYYIISHYKNSVNPYFWFIADFVCLFIFAGTFTKSYRFLKAAKENRSFRSKNLRDASSSSSVIRCNSGRISRSSLQVEWGAHGYFLGPLPLSYTSWIFYAVLLTGKVGMILKSEIPDTLKGTDTFGPQMLKVTIALSSIIYFLLVEGHSECSPGPQVVRSICAHSILELLDTISFMSILLVKETNALEDVVVVLTAINFLLPTLPLYSLAVSGFGAKPVPLVLSVLRDLLHLFLLDIPYLVIRVYFWAAYQQNVSIFLMKNLLAIIIICRNIYPDLMKLFRKWRKGRVIQGSGTVEKHELQNFKQSDSTNTAQENKMDFVPEGKRNNEV